MGDFRSIANVGDALRKLLVDNLGAYGMDKYISDESIILGSPFDVEGFSKYLSIFLYKVRENTYMKNLEVVDIGACQRMYPPLALDLHFLITASVNDERMNYTKRTLLEHRILGYAISVLYNTPVLSSSLLNSGMTEDGEELRVLYDPINIEELGKIWSSIGGKTLKFSAGFVVTPVEIEFNKLRRARKLVENE